MRWGGAALLALLGVGAARGQGPQHHARVADLGWPGPDRWGDLPPAKLQFVLERQLVVTVPKHGKPQGVVFATHGCLQYVTEFGWKSRSCPECHGSPEMMGNVWKFVRQGYAVVGMGAHKGGDAWRCYETRVPMEDYPEMENMIAVMHHVLTEHKWWGLPRFLWGSSSGGVISLMAALRFPVHAVCSLLMGVRKEQLADLQPRNIHSGATWPYPPVFMMRMLEDEDHIQVKCNATIDALRREGVDVRDLHLQSYPLGEDAFARRMPGVSLALSREIFRRLTEVGVLVDGWGAWHKCENCWDPAYTKVKEVLWDLFPHWEDHHIDRCFKEIVWASQGAHDTTAAHTEAVVAFFEEAAQRLQGAEHLKKGSRALATQAPLDGPQDARGKHSSGHGLAAKSGSARKRGQS